MSIFDTPGKRGALLVQSFMTGEQKFLLTYEMSMFDRGVIKQKLRREHPEWSKLEVMHEIIRQAFHSEPVPEWLERKMQQRLDEQHARQLADL
ncbi:MAG TPA: hypothetical protein VHA06_15270 [Candidatus Angelobacter sp.]|jgi:hypothetical protein|nr:hypothetical protein [Candidatus Angelobacter sp.]